LWVYFFRKNNEKRVEDGVLGDIIVPSFAGLAAKGRSMRDVQWVTPVSVSFVEVVSVRLGDF
jgi:hypothetical protein